jgi:hypothetical protein
LLAFWLGCTSRAVPWMMIAIYLESAVNATDPPDFVYGIFFSLFAFFNVFPLNMWLQYRRLGPWRSDLFGESTATGRHRIGRAFYLLLSLTAKAALAWQVFFSRLVD